MPESEVWELQDPSGVNEAVARLQVAVIHDVAVVEVDHALGSEELCFCSVSHFMWVIHSGVNLVSLKIFILKLIQAYSLG